MRSQGGCEQPGLLGCGGFDASVGRAEKGAEIMLRRILCVVVTAVFLFGSVGAVFAQEQNTGVQYKKETRYDFDDDLVEGELQRPDGMIVGGDTKSKHSLLIKVRLDFVPELVKSAENI